MPREARLVLDNMCYNIITHGNGGQVIFRDDEDYRKYLRLLARYKEKYGFKLYGWCLVNPSVYLVMESDSLSKVMHGINLSYAQYFNNKHERTGYFWHDRFESYTIQKDSYLINCILYVEYNPVRTKIVQRPEDYQWSSYRARVLGGRDSLLDFLFL